jgi:ATP-binding cassette subfamily A (ABC1) protein 3
MGASSPSPVPAKEADSLVSLSTSNKSHYFEPVSEALRGNLGVSIQNLRRVFHTDGEAAEYVAVKDMNLDLYSGQILALLGHNGAGKTTTINMLSGMIAPSDGDAFVYGSSIRSEMAAVRKILGVCPQHNILFDLLTVKEHLELFAAIKDVPSDQTEAAIQEMVAQVGLQEKINDKSAALSGGMQRKLSVGIALLGDSKIIFLDEPTSGMVRSNNSLNCCSSSEFVS